MEIRIRRAGPKDQPQIAAMVRRAHLNPSKLEWSRFMLAEYEGRPVGVAQVRVHPDGTRELASLVVDRAMQGRGVATRMVDALLAEEKDDVFTLIDQRFVRHFERWGFSAVPATSLPRYLKRTYRIGSVVTTLGSLLRRDRIRIVPLLRARSS